AGADDAEDAPAAVTVVREARGRRGSDPDEAGEVQSLKGSTRLEAKKQRRREGREQGRRRVPVITEAEFLARRESVERVMLVRQAGDRTQIGVLEDGILVEHYVNRATASSFVGNVYLGRVQNVLPSMEAAFVDISKGRNGVLYAGEVNWDAAGLEGQPKRIEVALKSGDPVLVQVTKDPIGHKGARLTSQVSLPGRYLVYVPDGSMTGISRKLPDTERARLKSILKRVVPEDAGVIVRTAAEGASEEELARDVTRLRAQWEDISRKASSSSAPALLYGEPDMTVRVIRDVFNEDFSRLVVSGDDAWDTIHPYVSHVAPDLVDRVSRWTEERDVFGAYRVDEQLAKALDRKVWLPSGGSLVIDRTEAMVVVDVNTGKFIGKGGNLEETVTKNNIEAAEEIVRQLRLRDLGGIIVIDFIDMVLESNRELVLRRLLECLGRDRTKHQVAEVTSLGLVQMTRKRVGQGLLEAFSEPCERCNGRGVLVSTNPVDDQPGSARRGRAGGVPTPADVVRAVAAAPRSAAVEATSDVAPEPDAPEPDASTPDAGGVTRDEPATVKDVAVEAAAGSTDAVRDAAVATDAGGTAGVGGRAGVGGNDAVPDGLAAPELSGVVGAPVGQDDAAPADPPVRASRPRRRRGASAPATTLVPTADAPGAGAAPAAPFPEAAASSGVPPVANSTSGSIGGGIGADRISGNGSGGNDVVSVAARDVVAVEDPVEPAARALASTDGPPDDAAPAAPDEQALARMAEGPVPDADGGGDLTPPQGQAVDDVPAASGKAPPRRRPRGRTSPAS
ncbi:MAG: Rne/Rng family ribonuclease, partial [Actinomycetota bacterium]|nr:Rne/Rng family ribonuclease [Actinomycetota bacterium]